MLNEGSINLFWADQGNIAYKNSKLAREYILQHIHAIGITDIITPDLKPGEVPRPLNIRMP